MYFLSRAVISPGLGAGGPGRVTGALGRRGLLPWIKTAMVTAPPPEVEAEGGVVAGCSRPPPGRGVWAGQAPVLCTAAEAPSFSFFLQALCFSHFVVSRCFLTPVCSNLVSAGRVVVVLAGRAGDLRWPLGAVVLLGGWAPAWGSLPPAPGVRSGWQPSLEPPAQARSQAATTTRVLCSCGT